MMTVWGEQLDRNHVLQDYPRPQLRREHYTILNGLWDYAMTASDQPPEKWDGKILVPFSPEAPLSGVNRSLRPGEYLWYRRRVDLKAGPGERALLHIGAADQVASVYVDGCAVGGHTGGYTSFTLDLTEYLTGDSELLIRVRDDTEGNLS